MNITCIFFQKKYIVSKKIAQFGQNNFLSSLFFVEEITNYEFMIITEEQKRDYMFLFKERYHGDKRAFLEVWGEEVDEIYLEEWIELGIGTIWDTRDEDGEIPVPTIAELTKDAYRQLKESLTKSQDPSRIAKTIEVLDKMKDKQAESEQRGGMTTISEKIESLLKVKAPKSAKSSIEAVVSEHKNGGKVKKPKPVPSKDVNGLNEASDHP